MVRKCVSMVLIWLFLVFCAFTFLYRPGYMFQIDESYQLWGWPGLLVQEHPDGSHYMGLEIKEYVAAYAIRDPYIIGKTEKGWFALHKKSRQVWYPLSSEEELQEVLGTDTSAFNLRTSAPWTTLIGIWPFTGICAAAGVVLISIPIIRHKRRPPS